MQTLRTPNSKNICERLLLIVVMYCIENWIKLFRTRLVFCFFQNIKLLYFTYSHSYLFVLSLLVIRCHSLSFFVIRCHWLSPVHSLYHSSPLVVIRCTNRSHSLSLDVRLVCLFINDLLSLYSLIKQHVLFPLKTFAFIINDVIWKE